MLNIFQIDMDFAHTHTGRDTNFQAAKLQARPRKVVLRIANRIRYRFIGYDVFRFSHTGKRKQRVTPLDSFCIIHRLGSLE